MPSTRWNFSLQFTPRDFYASSDQKNILAFKHIGVDATWDETEIEFEHENFRLKFTTVESWNANWVWEG
mgnify:CR=1 FL=1